MAEEPKSVARKFFEGVNANDPTVIDELVADDFVERETFPGISPTRRREAILRDVSLGVPGLPHGA